MVKVLAHTTNNPSSNPTIYIYKCQRWALGHLYMLSCLIFYLILSTINHVFFGFVGCDLNFLSTTTHVFPGFAGCDLNFPILLQPPQRFIEKIYNVLMMGSFSKTTMFFIYREEGRQKKYTADLNSVLLCTEY